MKKGPVVWGLILFLSMLFWVSYLLHAAWHVGSIWILGPYSTLSLLPIAVGALLRARRGALISWLLTMTGFLVAILTGLGSSAHLVLHACLQKRTY